MKSIVAIRTHRWTEAEDRLLGQLRAAFGDDVVVVFHERAPDVTPGCEVVDLNAAWAQEQGLRTPRDWGWRCGDYFFYALRAARPDYDHYWLVEPDVLFLGDPAAFFARFAQVEDDILGLDPEPMNAAKRMFVASMPGMDHWRAIFALTRISGRALERLLPLRQENSKAPVGQMRFANDEAFVYSHAMAEDDLRVGNLRDHAPDWFEGAPFDTAPDMIEEAVLDRDDLRGKVLHPVHGKAAFKAEIAKRATKRLNFVENLGESLDYLDDSDLEEIADDLRRRALNTMHQFKRKRRKAIRQARMQRAAE